MTDNDANEKLRQLLAEGAKATSDAMQAFVRLATQAAQGAADGAAGSAAGGDPAELTRAWLTSWQAAVSELSALQTQLLKGLLTELPETARERLNAQTFSQLERMAAANWEEELRRFSEVPATLSERASQADPERLGGLLKSMTAEYLADLEGLKGSAFQLDTEALADAWAKVAAGAEDADAKRLVERFLEAVSVKARYGSEYYADPERTPVGQTPRRCVHRYGKIELYHYERAADAPQPRGEPVLLVYSVINKPYILDLLPGFSFVEHLIAEGLDVYLVEWGETEPGDRDTTLDSYIDPGLSGCVAAIRERTGAEKVSLFGHCIGGNLALMYAALRPAEVGRVVTLTTPITAADGGVVAVWTDRDLFPIDAILDATGHMPAKLIRYTFMVLKPYYEVMKWKLFLEKLGDDEVMKLFYPVDRWANENVDIPGAVFKKFVEEVFHGDRFRNSETLINGAPVKLKNVTCPVMNLTATRDWIVPPASAEILGTLVGSQDYRHVSIEGAHVTIMIDPRTRPLWTEMSDFLAGP
ncbi:MAG: alpha/beta fold hydrolase [bacterium]